jgi:hypothetical protein
MANINSKTEARKKVREAQAKANEARQERERHNVDDAASFLVELGRPSAIVVTSAAVAALDDHELAAVLAHERAHLTGHHSLAVTTVRGLAAVFPKLTLMREGATQVSRLLEMCADDASARRHGSAPLLSGLITLCRAAPAEALGAADVAVLARAERLAVPPADPAITRARAALISVVAVLYRASYYRGVGGLGRPAVRDIAMVMSFMTHVAAHCYEGLATRITSHFVTSRPMSTAWTWALLEANQ